MHQDVRPKNVMTKGPNTYLIDFCLATEIKPERSGCARRGGLLGSPCFASISALKGKYQFPKDDLEALGYTLVWLLKGSLPWASDESGANLLDLEGKKLGCSVQELCQGCPNELVYYFNYIRGVKDNDAPNYEFLRGLLSFAHQGTSHSKGPVASLISDRQLQLRQKAMHDDLLSNESSSFLSISSPPGVEMPQLSEHPDFIEELDVKASSMKASFESIICSIGDMRDLSSLGLEEAGSSLRQTPKLEPARNDVNLNTPKTKPPTWKMPRNSKRLITIVEVKETAVRSTTLKDEAITQRKHFDLPLTPYHRSSNEKFCVVSTEPSDSPPTISRRLKRKMRAIRQGTPENSRCLIA
jgi:hypothetical protein